MLPLTPQDVAFKNIFLPDTLLAVCSTEMCHVVSDTLTGQEAKSNRLSPTTPTSAELKNPPFSLPKCLCLQRLGSTDFNRPGHVP